MLTRRRTVSLLAKWGALLCSLPFVKLAQQHSADEDFVIVDGWILRGDDLKADIAVRSERGGRRPHAR